MTFNNGYYLLKERNFHHFSGKIYIIDNFNKLL